MRVLVVPDSFTGTLTSPQAAAAITTGWQLGAAHDEVVGFGISDGGTGFVDALVSSGTFEQERFSVPNLVGQVIEITAAVDKLGKSYFFESAQIVGSQLLNQNDIKLPATYSSYGIGEAMAQAIDRGAKQIVIGLGGTASIDGGAGIFAALGATSDGSLSMGGAGLNQVSKLDITPAQAKVAQINLVIAADVDVPLLGPRGAAMGFGQQKGATPNQQAELEAALAKFSELVPIRPDGKHPAVMLGAGAAGGIGFALLALGARKEAGFAFVADALQLNQQIAAADLVVTGEGSFDWQSMQGKAISQLAQMCLTAGKPLLVLAGRVDVGRREWSALGIVGAYGCSEDGEISDRPADALSDLAARVARTFSPSSWQN